MGAIGRLPPWASQSLDGRISNYEDGDSKGRSGRTNYTQMHWNPAIVMAGGLVCAAAALILFAWLAGEVREGEMRPFDLWVHSVIYQPNSLLHLTAFMERVTTLGSGEFLVPLALGLVIAFLHEFAKQMPPDSSRPFPVAEVRIGAPLDKGKHLDEKRASVEMEGRSRDVLDDSIEEGSDIYCESGFGSILINCLPNSRASSE